MAADACPTHLRYPATDWTDRLQAVAAERPAQVEALERYLFPPGLDRADPERRGLRTDGVVVVHHGEIVYERYAGGYGPTTRHLAWSVTKSFMAALAGVAVGEGVLSLDDPICEALPDLPAASCAVTVRHLLEFSSGFDWRETYEGEPPTTSSVLAMLYGQGRGDMARFVASHTLRDPPGSTYMYSSGDTNVLSAVVGAALSPRHGPEYPWAVLLDPIGMGGATWERDGAGTYVGSSYLFATPRDLARFGTLLLSGGCWGDHRVLPAGWVADATRQSMTGKRRIDWDHGDVVGRSLWLNARLPDDDVLPWPSAPDDAFAALGHWGQSIFVVPSADLVVVRTADDRDHSFDRDTFLSLVLALVEAR